MAWTSTLLKQKLKALAIHLGIGLLIFVPLLYLLWFRWFPEPLFFTDGGWQGLRIMLFVDLAIGPTLTFLIFNPAKSRRDLTFDLSCIALIQAAALTYGIYSVEQKRMWAMALQDGAFHAVTLDSFESQKVPEQEWNKYGSGPLYWIYVREPKGKDEGGGVAAYAMMRGLMAYQLEFLYEPLSAHQDEFKKAAVDPKKGSGDAELDQGLKEYEAKHAGPHTYVKLEGYFRNAVLVFDDKNQYVDAVYASASNKH